MSSQLGEDIVRLLLVTPRGSLWDTVRPMTTSHDDALAVMAVVILAQTALDARLALKRQARTDEARAGEVEVVVQELMRATR
jgi:hypothetical protein